jgi:hypothetical protein
MDSIMHDDVREISGFKSDNDSGRQSVAQRNRAAQWNVHKQREPYRRGHVAAGPLVMKVVSLRAKTW